MYKTIGVGQSARFLNATAVPASAATVAFFEELQFRPVLPIRLRTVVSRHPPPSWRPVIRAGIHEWSGESEDCMNDLFTIYGLQQSNVWIPSRVVIIFRALTEETPTILTLRLKRNQSRCQYSCQCIETEA